MIRELRGENPGIGIGSLRVILFRIYPWMCVKYHSISKNIRKLEIEYQKL